MFHHDYHCMHEMMEIFGGFFCSQYQLKVLITNAVLTDLDLDRAEKSDRAVRFDESYDLIVTTT
jgi:hypothetical protein